MQSPRDFQMDSMVGGNKYSKASGVKNLDRKIDLGSIITDLECDTKEFGLGVVRSEVEKKIKWKRRD